MPNCRSCGAPVRWVETSKGKKMPIDINPNPNGNVILIDGVAHYVKDDPFEKPEETAKRYVSHFATCPNAQKHRKEQ